MILRRHRSEERRRQGTALSHDLFHTASRVPALPVRPIPIRDVAPWMVFAGLMLLLVTYFVGAEQGAMSLVQGMGVHELVHDGRHLPGFPCH